MTKAEQRRLKYRRYYLDIAPALQEFCGEGLRQKQDYVQGSRRIDYDDDTLSRAQRARVEYLKQDGGKGLEPYETALHRRVRVQKTRNLIVLVGGLGSGKTTTVGNLALELGGQQTFIRRQLMCDCKGRPDCFRVPNHIDNSYLYDNYSAEDVVKEVLRNIRNTALTAIVQRWLSPVSTFERPLKVAAEHRAVLEDVILCTDVRHLARQSNLDRSVIPRSMRRDRGGLLEETPTPELVNDVVKEFSKYSVAVEEEIAKLTQPELDRLTSNVLFLNLKSCTASPDPPKSPKVLNPLNLVIVDNVDQLPTEHIEAVLASLESLAAVNKNFQIIVPLRPSSFGEGALTKILPQVLHYGPSSFEVVLRRICTNIFQKPRKATHALLFDSPLPLPARKGDKDDKDEADTRERQQSELETFLLATNLYAQIMYAGLRAVKS